jgi:acyl transferase domain-containing protein
MVSNSPCNSTTINSNFDSVAGILVEDLMNSRTGCYVGCMTNDYEMISLHDIYDISHPAASALSEAMTANRVSWFFGLKGPSLTIDTACSSSLYALHYACQSLRLRETNMVSRRTSLHKSPAYFILTVACDRSQPDDQPQYQSPAYCDAHA